MVKFNQLKIGERFRYQGAAYTKSGPLQAIEEGGSTAKLIMRAANVECLSATNRTDLSPDSESERLRRALDNHHQICQKIVLGNPENALKSLEQAYRKLLDELAL